MNQDRRIKVAVDLRLSDLVRANYGFIFRRWSVRFFFAFFIIMGITAAVLALTASKELLAPALFSLLMLFTPALSVSIIYLQTWRGFSNLKDFQKRQRFIFTDEGYDVGDEKSFSHLDWESVWGAIETKETFNIFLTKALFQVVPKRCLQSAEEIEEMRKLLERGLGVKAKLLWG